MAITAISFANKFKLTLTDFNTTEIDDYILRYEVDNLVELMGKELYDLYVIGIAGSDPIYEQLRDAFTEQLSDGTLLISKGVDDISLGVVYFYWSRDNMTQQTSNGPVSQKGENSENATLYVANIQSRWNEAVKSYDAIQRYICDNLTVYPTFKGFRKEVLNIF